MYQTSGLISDPSAFEQHLLQTLGTDPIVAPHMPPAVMAHYAHSAARIGAKLPSPLKTGLIMGGIAAGVGLLRGHGVIGPALGWGALGFVGALVIDAVTIGSYTLGFAEASGALEAQS
jgi:hypothetical protein